MNLRNKFLPTVAAASAVALGATLSAQADPTVGLSVLNTTTYAVNQLAGSYNGKSFGLDNVGIYSFRVGASSSPSTTGLNVNQTIYTVCLSPLGDVPGGTSTYTVETFAQANNGLNPALWAWNNSSSHPQYWGIENAAYLWRAVANGGQAGLGGIAALTGVNAKDAGAALALAMYTALYDSTGYGVFNAAGPYQIPGLSGTELLDYTHDIGLLSAAAVDANIIGGSVLVPKTSTSQDLIYINPNTPKLNPPVPEPTTMVAGVLLALPFGASALRILRKKTIA